MQDAQAAADSAQRSPLIALGLVCVAGIPADAYHGIVIAVDQINELLIMNTIAVGILPAVQRRQHIFHGCANTKLDAEFDILVAPSTVFLERGLAFIIVFRVGTGMGDRPLHTQSGTCQIGAAGHFVEILDKARFLELRVQGRATTRHEGEMALIECNPQFGSRFTDLVDFFLPVVAAKHKVRMLVGAEAQIKGIVPYFVQNTKNIVDVADVGGVAAFFIQAGGGR